MRILITGAAGFIGSNILKMLLATEHKITAIDNINNYYDVKLKYDRLLDIGFKFKDGLEESSFQNVQFYKIDISDKSKIEKLFSDSSFDLVINMAAQAGVRFSIDYPDEYVNSNIIGFYNILEACRKYDVKKLIFASSSSVYGNSDTVPFTLDQKTDRPISLYAATKKSNELLAHTYAHLYGIKTIGLRFFTVYGPWGRPDMAYYIFTKSIIEGLPIQVFQNGQLSRDFTYIDDIINTIKILVNLIQDDTITNKLDVFNILNVGNEDPVLISDFISIIETNLGKKAIKIYKEMQPGDVYITYSDTSETTKITNYKPNVKITEGMNKFISWYKAYYGI